MSNEELKIRSELEIDIERDLEEEIKDGIYHLTLRLHRLYQHQKERRDQEKQGKNNKKETLSEVNINIKMEGGTKIEIKETKKEASDQNGRPRSSSTRSENMHEIVATNRKKFDWVNTLRSSKKTDDFIHHKPKLLQKSRSTNENVTGEGGLSLKKRKDISIKTPERREHGWKD